jgi:hypothetical protein
MRLICAVLLTFVIAWGKDRKAPPKAAEDEIEVVGHIALSSGQVVNRFLTTQHYSSAYLYAESVGTKTVTLIDMTRAGNPRVLGDVAVGGGSTLFAVAGTAAVSSDGGTVAPAPIDSVRTIRILNFADPLHPKVTREFTGVTATSRDERRGLIYVANGEGIWILRQKLADDPEVEKAYAHHVIYDH